jgi:iron-sulfur cluster assembly protein
VKGFVWVFAPQAVPALPTCWEFVDEVVAEDQVFESHGEKVIIDPKSLAYLDGTELDFVKEGLNEGFKFNNPNVRGECGCGESFNI